MPTSASSRSTSRGCGPSISACACPYVSCSRLRTRARTTPASVIRPCSSRVSVHTSAGRTSPGSRLAAFSLSTVGYSGTRRSGAYNVIPRWCASTSNGSPPETKAATSAIA